MKSKTVFKKKCRKCNYEWWAEVEKPKLCPACKCRKWKTYKRKES